MDTNGYNKDVERIRREAYQLLSDQTYLDHAAVTPYSTTLIDAVASDLKANLFGNPHSLSSSSLRTTRRIDDVRVQVLRMFNADPNEFDVVFVANVTAGLKMVGEMLEGRKMVCHEEVHTSLVGVRNLMETSSVVDNTQMEEWIALGGEAEGGLVAWPAQSNFSGEKYPWSWAGQIRQKRPGWYTLVDAAAYASTNPINLSILNDAPDFMVLSFLKMFGYPDLAGLIVRKAQYSHRRFFGGGTVEFLVNGKEHIVVRKETLHDQLEDGTAQFHSIIALEKAIKLHIEMFGSFHRIRLHVDCLARQTWQYLNQARHYNGANAVEVFGSASSTMSLNFRRADGSYVGYNEVAKIADVRNIHLRTGGMCNPGGIMRWVGLTEADFLRNLDAGKKCGDENDLMDGKPTGAVRISFGAMSAQADADKFLKFVDEFFVEKEDRSESVSTLVDETGTVERITIYPIKSCAGFDIPPKTEWAMKPHGLAWDREWCVVHIGTGRALDQKRYPIMATLQPTLVGNTLRVSCPTMVPLLVSETTKKECQGRVCTDDVLIHAYSEQRIVEWFSQAIGTPCTLARMPPTSQRYHKAHLAPLKFSNESPLLIVNRESYNVLAERIRMDGGRVPPIDVFRANVIISGPKAYAEDGWTGMRIGDYHVDLLGACRRCYMVCVDQKTGERHQEPYIALSKTRKREGKVFFGIHAKCAVRMIMVGDAVCAWEDVVKDV